MAIIGRERIEATAKALPLVLAALYVAGFIIVAFRLAGYGTSTLDLFRIQYVAAGFWFGLSYLTFSLFFAAARPVVGQYLFQVVRDTSKRVFLQRNEAQELAGAVIGNVSIVAIFGLVLFVGNIMELHFGKHVRVIPPLFSFMLFVAGIDICIRAWLLAKARQNDGIAFSSEAHFSMFLLAMLMLVSLQIFARDVYPVVPFSMGGGQTRQVVFWLGPKTSPSTTTAAFLERDGIGEYTVPYELLLENENSFVVVSPKDNQRSIEFDRRSVEAMVVLGKRPSSAPANFQRNVVSEPTVSKYEVVERTQKQVPNFMAQGTHTEVDYVLSHDGYKYYAACDTTTLNKLDPAATCAFRVLRSYECVQPTDAEQKQVLSDLKCKDDEGHPIYLYVGKKE